MSRIAVLRPNATAVQVGVWPRDGVDTGTDHGQVTTDNDESWLGTPGDGLRRFDLTTDVEGPGEKVWRTRVRLYTRFNEKCRIFGDFLKGGSEKTRSLTVDNWNSTFAYHPALGLEYRPLHTGNWINNIGGQLIVAADIDNLQFELNIEKNDTGSAVEPIEVYVDLEFMLPPTAALTLPVGTKTPLLPFFQWTRGEIDTSQPQKKFNIKIYDKATADGGGFDPETTAGTIRDFTLDSGATVTSHTMAGTSGQEALDPGTEYVAFIRIAKNDPSGDTWWSEFSARSDFTTSTQPVATVTAPAEASTVSDTDKPIIGWNYSDGDGISQSRYHVVVEEEPAGGWGAETEPIDPASAPTNSGEVSSAATTHESKRLDNNKNHRAWVRVRKGSGSTAIWSEWDHNDFLLDLVAPSVPQLELTPDIENARMKLDVTGGVGVDNFYYTIEHFLDGEWSTLRGIDKPSASSGVQTFFDYEVPFNEAVSFRVITTDEVTTGQAVSTSSAIEVASLDVPVVWLKIPDGTGQHNMHAVNPDTYVGRTRIKPRTIHRPMGDNYPIVIKGQGQGERISLNVLVIGEAQYQALLNLIDLDETMYVQTPQSSWYAELDRDVEISERLWDALRNEEPVWRVNLGFTEVEKP